MVLLDINEEANQRTLEEITRNGGKGYAFKCDVSDAKEVYKVAKEVENKVWQVSILVNNAGILYGKRILDLADAQIEKIFKINIIAHFWVIQIKSE